MVVLLSYFYSLGDGVLMKLNAEGKLTVFKWPRLFYILSLMIAGWAADLRGGRVLAPAALAAAAVTGFYPFFLAGGCGGLPALPPLLLVLRRILRRLLQRPVHAHGGRKRLPRAVGLPGQDNKTVRQLRRRSTSPRR